MTPVLPGCHRRRLLSVRHAQSVAAAPVRHLITGPGAPAEVVLTALCGLRIPAERAETLDHDSAPVCSLCRLCLTPAHPHPGPLRSPSRAGTGASAVLRAAAGYRALGWPVTLRRDQVLLALDARTRALLVPREASHAITTVLSRRGHRFPVVSHPGVPDHRILLAGQPAGIALPWPDQARLITGTLLLPPTGTPAGPVSWAQSPHGHHADTCREIDLHHAVRTVLHDQPEQDQP